MARTDAWTEEEIVKAVRGSGGFVTEIARRIGCTRATIYKYKRQYKAIADAIFEEKEHLLDTAESELLKKIKSGNMTGIIFYLKTQGYKRGYGDRTKLDIDGKFITKDEREKDKAKDAEYIGKVLDELERLKLAPVEDVIAR